MRTIRYRPRPDVAYHYTAGWCHALALAIHRVTGLRILAVRERDGPDHAVAHFVVEHPSSADLIIDIHGARPLAEVLESYSWLQDVRVQRTTPREIRRWMVQGQLYGIGSQTKREVRRLTERFVARLRLPVVRP